MRPLKPYTPAPPSQQLLSLRLPWGDPILTEEEMQRGITYYGSGARLRAVAHKLLQGRRVKVGTAVGLQVVLRQVPAGCLVAHHGVGGNDRCTLRMQSNQPVEKLDASDWRSACTTGR